MRNVDKGGLVSTPECVCGPDGTLAFNMYNARALLTGELLPGEGVPGGVGTRSTTEGVPGGVGTRSTSEGVPGGVGTLSISTRSIRSDVC